MNSNFVFVIYYTPVFLPEESLWTEEPGRLQSKQSQRVRHNSAIKHTHILIVCIRF